MLSGLRLGAILGESDALWRSAKSWIFVSVYRSKHRKFSLPELVFMPLKRA